MSILTIENLKLAYNYNLQRFNKATRYFENTDPKENEKWLPNYIEIINNMGILIDGLKNRGIEVTPEEIESGFNI